MRELEAKQRKKHLIYSYPSLAILLLITALTFRGALNIVLKERASAKKVSELRQDAEILIKEKVKVAAKIDRIQTEEGIKEEIRKKFSVVEAGEQVAVIVSPRITSTSSLEADQGWFKKVWKSFKNLWQNSPSGYNPEK